VKKYFTRDLDFPTLFTLITAVFGTLSVTLLLWPAVIHWLFQITSDPATDVMSRRAAMLFAGLSFIVWQARTAPDSLLRQGICFGVIVGLGGLAMIGCIELISGTVGIGITLAVIAELYLVAHLVRFWRGAH
jgi:hypothetical protein